MTVTEIVHPATLKIRDKIFILNDKYTVYEKKHFGTGIESILNTHNHFIKAVNDTGQILSIEYPPANCFGSKTLEAQFLRWTQICKIIL